MVFARWCRSVLAKLVDWKSRPAKRRRSRGTRASTYWIWFEPLEDRFAPANTTYRWTGAIDNNWTTAGNWTVISGNDATFPNATTDIAQFTNSSVTRTAVTVNQAITVGELDFDKGNSYTISGSSTLTFQGATSATLSVASSSTSNNVDLRARGVG